MYWSYWILLVKLMHSSVTLNYTFWILIYLTGIISKFQIFLPMPLLKLAAKDRIVMLTVHFKNQVLVTLTICKFFNNWHTSFAGGSSPSGGQPTAKTIFSLVTLSLTSSRPCCHHEAKCCSHSEAVLYEDDLECCKVVSEAVRNSSSERSWSSVLLVFWKLIHKFSSFRRIRF